MKCPTVSSQRGYGGGHTKMSGLGILPVDVETFVLARRPALAGPEKGNTRTSKGALSEEAN